MSGGGRKSRRSTMPNMAAFAPMPRARVDTTAIVKPGFMRRPRMAYFRSCRRLSNVMRGWTHTEPESFMKRRAQTPKGARRRRARDAEGRETPKGARRRRARDAEGRETPKGARRRRARDAEGRETPKGARRRRAQTPKGADAEGRRRQR